MTQDARTASIARVQRELTTIGRRGTARVRRENEALSIVDRSLLAYIREHPGCRAIEIAAHYELNRSTVSRQLSALTESGCVVNAPDEHTGRGQALSITARGVDVLDAADEALRVTMTGRLRGWSEAEIAAFAAMLERYNDADGD
ncbi:MarR family winged helix-turn-helix transcriptional regulator [Leifsonia sp. NPDC077715]|uniref:MarR family winged helix-turn-helix transcriptional regulator n=1 Tax=Leifsonia sp. NPDC077715 TaxID=3155539 RepID=UPI00342105C2